MKTIYLIRLGRILSEKCTYPTKKRISRKNQDCKPILSAFCWNKIQNNSQLKPPEIFGK